MQRKTYMWIAVVLAVAALAALLFSRPAGGPGTPREAQEDDIREAVFRYQFGRNHSGIQQNAGVYCLSIGEENQDPSDSFMTRFEGHQPPVKKASRCTASPRDGVRDRETGKAGLIFRVKAIHWRSSTDAEVDGEYYEGGLSAGGTVYQVRLQGNRWSVVGQRDTWIS